MSSTTLVKDNVKAVHWLLAGLKPDATLRSKGSIQNNANLNTQVKYHIFGLYWAETGLTDRQETCSAYLIFAEYYLHQK